MTEARKHSDRNRQLNTPRVLIILGAIGPLLTLVLLSTDIAISPWFTWTKSALSDLGVHPYSLLFNGGIFIEGVLNIGFIYALYRYFDVKKVVAAVLIIAGISLSMVGVFNEHFSGIHITLALIYFVLFPAGIIGFSIPRSRKTGSERMLGISLSVIGLAFIAVGILEDFSLVRTPLGLGFYEFVEALCLIVWSVEVSLQRFAHTERYITVMQ
jgi:hypothetical membrane protein